MIAPRFEIRHIPAYLMTSVIVLVILALFIHSWAFIYPAIIIQLVITIIDPILLARKMRLAGLFIYSAIEFLIAFVIYGIVEAIKAAL